MLPLAVLAQGKSSFFHHLGREQGLSQTDNVWVFHDSRGFVWLSSVDGVNRFDGLNTRVYRPESKSRQSMLGRNVTSGFFEDKIGDLWFCTYEALHCYRRKTDDFDHWQLPDPESGDTTRFGYSVFHLEPSGRLWLRVGEGEKGYLYFFDTKTYAYSKETPLTGDRHFVDRSANRIFSFYYANNPVLTQIELSEGPYVTHKVPLLGMTDLFVAHDTLVWLATNQGLKRYNPTTRQYCSVAPHLSSNGWIGGLEVLPGGKVAVSVRTKGLHFYAPVTDKWLPGCSYNATRRGSISSNVLSEHYVDSQENLWVSDWSSGVNFLNLNKAKMAHIETTELDVPFRAKATFLRGLAEDTKGTVWCVSYNGGIYAFEKDRPPRQITHAGNWDLLRVNAIHCDRNGFVWVAARKGIFWKAPHETEFRRLKGSEVINGDINCGFSETKAGELLWNGVGGVWEIQRMGTASDWQVVKKVLHPEVPTSFISYLHPTEEGDYFICNEAAEVLFLKKGEQPRKVFSSDLKACYEDPDKQHIWLATVSGLLKMNKQTLKYELFDETNGLPNQYLYCVLPDDKGRLWCASNKGIIRFDPSTQKAHGLGNADGVWENEFYSDVWLRTRSGEMWMGNRTVLNIFDPDKIKPVPHPPKIQITGVKVNDTDWKGDEYIGETQALTFGYDQNTLSFEFVALEYSDPANNRLLYRLKGLDTVWVEARLGFPGFVRYAQLPPNNYTFQIKAFNSDGVESEGWRELSITIRKPFWQTTWFIALVTALIAALLYGIYRYRLSQIRAQFRLSQLAQANELKAANSEMKALRAQMNPHFIFNSLNSINAFILRNERTKASGYLLAFSNLIRHILDSSAKETVTLEKEIPFLEDYLQAESLRLEGKLTYALRVDEAVDTFDTTIPSMLLQPYLENAIWHGISPKPEGGHLSVEFKKSAEGLLIVVADNGIGREKARLLKAQKTGSHESKGLQITKERLALYDRKNNTHSTITTIDLTDAQGAAAGTRVQVRIGT